VDSLVVPVAEAVPAEDSVYEEVLNNNPEYRALKVRSALEEQNIRVASSFRKPSLSLVGQYQVVSQTQKFGYGNAHYPSSSFVGLQLSVPLFTGLSARARVDQAALTKNQSDL